MAKKWLRYRLFNTVHEFEVSNGSLFFERKPEDSHHFPSKSSKSSNFLNSHSPVRLTHRSALGRRISSFWRKKRMEFFFGGILDVREKTRKNSGNDLMDLTNFTWFDWVKPTKMEWTATFLGGDHRIEPSIFSGYDSVWRMRWFCHHKWHRALYFSVLGELSCWNTSGFGGLCWDKFIGV